MTKIFISIMFIFISSHVIAEANNKNKIMKVAYFHDYEPFSWKDEKGKVRGILIDVLDKVLKEKMGVNLDHKGYPWARAQYLVKMNRADAFVTVPTPERKEYTIVSKRPVINVAFTMFVNFKNIHIEDLKKIHQLQRLKKYKHVSYLGDGWAKKKLKNMSVVWESSMKDVLKLLSMNTELIFIDTSPVINYNIKKYAYHNKVIEINNALDNTSFNLCIGKNSIFKNLINEFDKNIKKIEQSGELQEIYNKYK